MSIPALTTRRAETTVELGSGQTFMIAGLLSNKNNNAIDKAPFLGDLPILGALFRSTSYQRNETELVIIVTPYLVRPVSGRLALPTDGYVPRLMRSKSSAARSSAASAVASPRQRRSGAPPGLTRQQPASVAAPPDSSCEPL